jgi:dienelactone hydrolase
MMVLTSSSFGGKYVARFLAKGKGLDAGFTAHPSAVEPAEWQGIVNPISIAFGGPFLLLESPTYFLANYLIELDGSSTPTQRASIEGTFITQNTTFQTSLYSNAEHGFAVRTNLSDIQKAFAQESAYYQAVRFFDAYL